jgi:uncharacterized protein
MPILRFVLIVLAVWLAVQIVRVLWRRQRLSRRGPATPLQVHDVVRCVHCGLHVPQREAVRDGEQYYCSTAHRLAHDKDNAAGG